MSLREHAGINAGDPTQPKLLEDLQLWPDWMVRGLCRQTDPEAFYPEKGGSTREVKKICLACEVRQDCLQYAVERDERFGIWGGLSERERRKLKRRRKRPHPPIHQQPGGISMTSKPLRGLAAITIDDLHPSPNNPREKLTEIDELAASIREVGLIQPLVVQKIPGQDGFQVVAGHRRLEACKRIQMREIPCVIRRDMLPDEELLTMLVENGQRADLDPIEEARALNRLASQGLTQAEIARKIGRSTMHVSNRLTLLSLPIEEQEQLRAGAVTIGAATTQARVTSGRTRPRAKGKKSAQHLSVTHDLATRAKARCQRLGHKSKGAASVGGIACGECWESVIRADEREHLNAESNRRGRCVLCDVAHDTDPLEAAAS
jgi:ParB family transcriptional regulator, chromosome partitioning protein